MSDNGVDAALGGLSAHECLPWSDLLEYERTDIIRHLLRILSTGFFARDRITLVEREEREISSHPSGSFSMDSLMLTGHVGYVRREAVVSLVRDVRLRRVRDLVSTLSTGHVAGDAVPHLMLEPLETNAAVRSYRRWHKARCAMQAGLLQKLQERREHTRERLRMLLYPTNRGHTSSTSRRGTFASSRKVGTALESSMDEETTDDDNSRATFDSDDISESGSACPSVQDQSVVHVLELTTARSATDDGFKELFSRANSSLSRHPASSVSPPREAYAEEEGRRLALFAAGAKEQRVDINAIAATVPTVFVVWSYLYRDAVDWLREHLFNDDAVRELHSITGGIPNKFAVLFDVDPWLRFVGQHIAIPPRQRPNEKLQRLAVLPITSKRAQIVLVNVDKSREDALAVYHELASACKGWESGEVSLLSLWAGADGLQSPLCTEFGVDRLPFLFATTPMHRSSTRGYRFTTPSIAKVNSPGGTLTGQPVDADAGERASSIVVDTDHTWGEYPRERRRDLCERVSAKLAGNGLGTPRALPLRFSACVEKTYRTLNPHATIASKAIRTDSTSWVRMKGRISDADLDLFRDELVELARVRDFDFSVRVMRCAGSVAIELDPPNPTRIVQNVRRAVTCSVCLSVIDLDTSAHFRCLHCGEQDNGVLCELCARTHMAAAPNTFLDNGGAGLHGRTQRGKADLAWEQQERKQQLQLQKQQRRRASRWLPEEAVVGLHPQHHVFLRIPPLQAGLLLSESRTRVTTVPLLWGDSNVGALPQFCGRLIVNTSQQHLGVYCNRCRSIVTGTRWKCAVCYEFDLCQRCFEHQESSPGTGPHARWHPMLCLPHAIDGDADRILLPVVVEDPLREELAATGGRANADAMTASSALHPCK